MQHALTRAAPCIRSVSRAEEWQDLFNAVPHPHLTQAYAYGEAKASTAHWRVDRLVFEREGEPVAICQVLERRIAGFVLMARINRGPMFLDPRPDLVTRLSVMQMVRHRYRLGRSGPLIIAPALHETEENRALMKEAGFRVIRGEGWCSSLVDLRQTEEVIRSRFAATWRNRLRSAERSGLTLRVSQSDEALQWMLDRHAENMRSKRFSGPSRSLLQALHKSSPGDFLILQALQQGEPVAGMILARFGPVAEYYVGWFGEAGRQANCGNFLYWHAICEARRAGHLWFDLGGYYSNDRFSKFKQNVRGAEYRLTGDWIAL